MNAMLKMTLAGLSVLLMPTVLAAEVADRIVIVVNKKVITQSQVAATQQDLLAQKQLKSDTPAIEQFQKALDFLVDNELIQQKAKELGVLVNEDELKAALDDIKKRNNLMTDDELKAAIHQQGQLWDVFLDDIRNQIKMAKVMNREVRSQIQIADDDVRAYYDEHPADFQAAPPEVQLSQIVLNVPENATAAEVQAIQAKATQIAQDLRQGADFVTLAQQLSEHPSGKSGGELGTFKEGKLAAPFDVAFTLAEGQISDPVRSDTGFHVLYVKKKTGGAEASFENAKTVIRRRLYEEKTNALYKEWIAKLRAEAYLETPPQ